MTFLPGEYTGLTAFLPGEYTGLTAFLPGEYTGLMTFLPGEYTGLTTFLPGEPVGGCTTESVMHSQCNARPTVTFPASKHHRQYQFILLGKQRHMSVNNLPRVIT